MALVTFDELGKDTKVVSFGAETNGDGLAFGAEVPAKTQHTVIELEHGCVLVEVKAGPFDPYQPKNQTPWAPDENSTLASRS